MTRHGDLDLQHVVQSAIAEDGVESAVVFVLQPGSSALEVGASAGIEGRALDGLATAVRNPAHPISRTIADDAATFDVQPTAPGGPALRSHVPLVARDDGRRRVKGVLAVAHQHRLDPDSRRVLERLAATAAALLSRPAQQGPDESG